MRLLQTIWVAMALALMAGCTSTGGSSILDQLGLAAPAEESNPLFVPLNKDEYGKVFEKALHVLDNFGFDIVESNRADGRIETMPRVAPGVFLLFKPGSPDIQERIVSTAQSYRHRATVLIQASAQGGYFIEVQVRKDLEDIPRPYKQTIGSAIFRLDNNVDRQLEVIDPSDPGKGWISRGRDVTVEQELLRRIKSSL